MPNISLLKQCSRPIHSWGVTWRAGRCSYVVAKKSSILGSCAYMGVRTTTQRWVEGWMLRIMSCAVCMCVCAYHLPVGPNALWWCCILYLYTGTRSIKVLMAHLWTTRMTMLLVEMTSNGCPVNWKLVSIVESPRRSYTKGLLLYQGEPTSQKAYTSSYRPLSDSMCAVFPRQCSCTVVYSLYNFPLLLHFSAGTCCWLGSCLMVISGLPLHRFLTESELIGLMEKV